MTRLLQRTVMTVTCLALLLGVSGTSLAADVESQIKHLLDTADLRGTQVSVYISDVTGDREIVNIDGNREMIPASNMKLLTTATAIDTLGDDFLFKTRLSMIESDQAPGNTGKPALVILGDGDPAFGDPVTLEAAGYDPEQVLEWWVNAVVETGVKQFGQIVVDDRVFANGPEQRVHPTWPKNQLHKRYCAQVMGINFFNNIFQVTATPTKPGQDVELAIYPYGPFVRTELGVVTGRIDQWDIITRADDNRISFRGQVRNRQRQYVTMHDPAMVFGQLLQTELAKRGIKVDQVTRPEGGSQLPAGQTLHQINTTLQAVLLRTNRDSMNLYAEALMKRCGNQITGQAGTFENGAAAVRASMTRLLKNPTMVSGIQVADGSGMSRDNRVSAQMIVTLLSKMHAHPGKNAYLASLGRPGDGGTLDVRFTDIKVAGEVYGKSGYINHVSAMSGYLVYPDQNDRTYAFSILCNGFGTGAARQLDNRHMKALQEKIVQMLDQSVVVPAGG